MFLFKQLAPGLAVAVLVTATLLLLARWFWGQSSWAGAVAVACGYAAGHVTTAGWPALPPAEATQWLFFFALITLPAGVLDTLLRPSLLARLGIWLALSAGLLALLLRSKMQFSWTPAQSVLWLLGLAAVMTLLAACLGRLARPGPDAVIALFTAAAVAGGSGVALMLSGSLLLGQLALVLAGALGVATVIAWFLPDLPLGRGIVPVAVALLTSLWATGYFYAELPALSAFLLGGAVVLPTLVPQSEARMGGRVAPASLAIRAVVVLVPVIAAVVVAFRASPSLDT